MKKNREKSDIIDKFIPWENGVDVVIPTAEYNKTYINTHQYNWFGSIQQITRCVFVGCDAIRKL